MRHLLQFLLTVVLVTAAAAADNLLAKNGKPFNIWPKNGATVRVAEDNTLEVKVPHGGTCNGSVYIKPEWKFIRITMEMKATDLVPGEAGWQSGRLSLAFYDKDKKRMNPYPKMFEISGTTDWKKFEYNYTIPEGAARLAVDPSQYGKSGTVEFRKLRVTAYNSKEELDSAYEGPALPPEAKLWDISDAWRLRTATRDRLSLNTVWAFLPTEDAVTGRVPGKDAPWLRAKVPGIWPATGGSSHPGSAQQIRRPNGAPEEIDGTKLNHAWYRRTIAVPKEWAGRKIELDMELVQTLARVFVNGKEAGELPYPGGRLDLTRFLKPGETAEIALLVSARPDPKAAGNYMAPGRIIPDKGTLSCRGIPGDVYLTALPADGALLGDIHLITSVADRKITCDVGFRELPAGSYRLETEIFDNGKSVKKIPSPLFTPKQLKNNRILFSAPWEDPELWDTDTPENLYTAKLTLRDGNGKLLDELEPEEFGFREFTISGRDFLLNGKKIHLRSLASSITKLGADLNTPDRIKLMATRMKEIGYNHAIGYHYNFNPGVVSRLDEFHRGLSRYGILTSFTLPHPAGFEWKLDDPEVAAAYRAQCEYLIRRFQNVPGVVLYAATHNATGYSGDQNPLRIDGVYSPDPFMKKTQPGQYQKRQTALRAGEIANEIDPTRPVYHHESGNLGALFTINCYLNWAPRQERSDWFEHWEKNGTKPLFLMEWGMPHVASWSSWRGPAFIWRSPGLQCTWVDEYDAAILGERAYRLGEKRNYFEIQEKLVSPNQPLHFSKLNWFNIFRDVKEVWAYMIGDNFRSIRARGVSGLLPWDQGAYWQQKAPSAPAPNPDCFKNLKQPGIVPDLLLTNRDYLLHPANEVGPLGEVTRVWFAPQVAWIAGKVGNFTEKGHNFRPGETVSKSLIVLNDSRRDRTTEYKWSVPQLNIVRSGNVTVEPGGRADLPVEFTIPADFDGDFLEINANFKFDGAPERNDLFRIDLHRESPVKLPGKIALFDPEGTAAPILKTLKIPYVPVRNSLPGGTAILVVGRNALDKLPFPVAPHLEAGLKMALLEQPTELFNRLGIRSNEQGLRELFPVGKLLGGKERNNWRGSSTLLPPYLKVDDFETKYPSWTWNHFSNSRVWRAGNRGTVSSVLPEKPAIGNWMPLLQGGFDLQYAPLLLFRSGKGAVLFSQLDISGRTEVDPEGIDLFGRALELLGQTPPEASRRLFYAGDDKTAGTLAELKFAAAPYQGEPLAANDLLVVGKNAKTGDLTAAVEAGANLLLIGLSQQELDAVLPGRFQTRPRKGLSDFVTGLEEVPEFAGITNSELHRRKSLSYDGFDPKSPGGDALECVRIGKGAAVALQYSPADFDPEILLYRTSGRRAYLLLNRLLHNLGGTVDSGLNERFDTRNADEEGRIELVSGWIGRADTEKKGRDNGWFQPEFKTGKEWRPVQVPGMFDLQFKELAGYDGLFWYRKNFDLPRPIPAGTTCTLYLGPVDDESWVWLNGKFLGELSVATNPDDFWAAERIYKLPAEAFKPTGNSLVVLVNDRQQNGGILGTPSITYRPEYRLYPDTSISTDDPYRYYRW